MSTLEILVLAQGVQSRLPDLSLPKQWLALPACGNSPILYRTLVQLSALLNGLKTNQPCIVTGQALRRLVVDHHRTVFTGGTSIGAAIPRFLELPDPGNSSLKGADRALDELLPCWGRESSHDNRDRVVVLLGDVVYSWECLDKLISPSERPIVTGTSDLSPSGGELWGIAWPRTWDPWVWSALTDALDNHPPFKEYQPGQLRRWYWALREAAARSTKALGVHCSSVDFVVFDDYTDDVDLPEDVKNLPLVAAAAAADDRKRGITWPI